MPSFGYTPGNCGPVNAVGERAAGEPLTATNTKILGPRETRKRIRAGIDYFLTLPCDDHGGSPTSWIIRDA